MTRSDSPERSSGPTDQEDLRACHYQSEHPLGRAKSAFGVPLDIHYDDGSLNLAVDGPVREYE
jgi:hypothetical protein